MTDTTNNQNEEERKAEVKAATETLVEATRIYRQKADAIAVLEESLRIEKAARDNVLETIDQLLNLLGVQSVPTPYGTPYHSVLKKYRVSDWDSFIQFVAANQAWEMLNKSVTKASADEWAQEHGHPPPGVVLDNVQQTAVRPPKKKQ